MQPFEKMDKEHQDILHSKIAEKMLTDLLTPKPPEEKKEEAKDDRPTETPAG